MYILDLFFFLYTSLNFQSAQSQTDSHKSHYIEFCRLFFFFLLKNPITFKVCEVLCYVTQAFLSVSEQVHIGISVL